MGSPLPNLKEPIEEENVRLFYQKIYLSSLFLDDAVNNVTLYDEVRSGQPILYAGSDDSYIYAVDMVDGHVKWKLKTEQDTGLVRELERDLG